MGYAEFKRRTGMPEAVAARCGDTNDRIDFVLQTFGVPAPRFVADVAPTVRDVMATRVLSVRPETTAAEALGLMDEHDVRVLPVLDEARHCRGLLSLFKVSLLPLSGRQPPLRILPPGVGGPGQSSPGAGIPADFDHAPGRVAPASLMMRSGGSGGPALPGAICNV
jgi:hypothetical protein